MTGVRLGQRGAALLLALIVSTIAAAIASSMVFRGELEISRTHQVARQVQTWQLAAGMEDWALTILHRDSEITPRWDGPDDLWAQPLPPTPVPGGEVAGSIEDLSGRFNLNSLVHPGDGTENPLAARRFRRLVVQVLNLSPDVVDQVLDLLDRDSVARPMGHESGPGPGFIAHASELRRLPAVDAATAAVLLPLVAALPPSSAINVNTAPAGILMSLAAGIDAERAAQAAPRRGRPWESVNQFLSQPALQDIEVEPEGLSVMSGAFRATARIVLEGSELEYHSVIFRGGSAADSSYHVRNRGISAP